MVLNKYILSNLSGQISSPKVTLILEIYRKKGKIYFWNSSKKESKNNNTQWRSKVTSSFLHMLSRVPDSRQNEADLSANQMPEFSQFFGAQNFGAEKV